MTGIVTVTRHEMMFAGGARMGNIFGIGSTFSLGKSITKTHSSVGL